MCFLDASKAFDRLPWNKTFDLMRAKGISETYVQFLERWCLSQKAAVKWDCTISSAFSTGRGVRQGSLISPKLFNLVMSVLSDRLTASGVGCYVSGQCINHMTYADDVVLVAPCVSALNKLLDICTEFASEYDLLFNPAKTKAIYCRPGNSNSLAQHELQPIVLDGTTVHVVDSHPYLGYIISSDYSDNRSVQQTKQKLYCTGNMLIQNFKNCDDAVKAALFKTFINSLLYLLQLWRNVGPEHIRQLKVAFHAIFKQLMKKTLYSRNSPVFVVNNTMTFQELRRKIVYNFNERLANSKNSVVRIFNRHTANQYFAFNDLILSGSIS